MDIISIIISLALGGVAGWLARFLMGAKGGLIRNIIVGVIGGFLGGFIFNILGISFAGYLGVVIQSLVGACALIFVCRLLLGK